jgi:hypothetical protein
MRLWYLFSSLLETFKHSIFLIASDLAESTFNRLYYKQTVRRNEEERTSKFGMIYEVRGPKI